MGRVMTAAELAKQLNLSRTTVSVVLNGRAERYGLAQGTVDKVLNGARRYNYRPDPVARQLAGMRSNVVGILVNSAVVDPRLIEKMEVRAAEKQLRFIVGHALDREDGTKIREYIEDFRSRRVDAIISFHHNNGAYRDVVLDELRKIDRVLYYERPDLALPDPWFVEVDTYEVGRIPTQHLIERGRKRIGLIALDESLFPGLAPRRRGYTDALRAASLPHGEELIWRVDQKRSLRWIEPPSEAEVEAVLKQLVVRGKADGIVTVNDLYVARIMRSLKRMGLRVPVDVALVGGDNMDIGTLVEPEITTVDVQIDALAEAAVNQLFNMLNEPTGEGAAGSGGDDVTETPPDTTSRRGRGSRSPRGAAAAAAAAESRHGIVVKPKLIVRQST
jgi:LacI family transcriptional regulator, galactose operon repressor